MTMTSQILRNSINGFFQNYHHFTSIATLLIFPASLSILLSESPSLSSKSILSALSIRIQTLFQAANFPENYFFSLLNTKLSQTIFSFSFSLPFTLTFLLVAKSCVIQLYRDSSHYRHLNIPFFSKCLLLYPFILSTHIFNIFVILSSNAATFSLMFLLFNGLDLSGFKSDVSVLFLSVIGAIIYSVIIATITVICNLALIISGMENCNGYISILKSCILIRGQVMTILTLTWPTSLAMAGVEALFQYRVMKQYRVSGKLNSPIMCEAFLITYIHSLLMVLEIIVSCMFYRKSRFGNREDDVDWREFEPEDKDNHFIV